MGKATIVSGGTDGKYMVKMDYGKAAQTANLERITKRQTELVGLQAAALQDLNLEMIIESLSLEAVENAIRDYVDAAADASATQQALADAEFANSTIASSVTATPAEKAAAAAAVVAAKTAAQNAAESFKKVPGAHAAALAKLVAAKAKTAKLQLVWQILKDEQTQLQKDHDYWAGLKLEETKEAWCADFTEDAKGVVEIMEIPGEDLKVLIGPQNEGRKLTNVGALTAREVQSPAQVFFNAAILPGWQKFKPTYRRGVIKKIDDAADTVDVEFEDDRSSAQKLDINRYKKLEAIPVKYMTCNSGAFEVGDRCVVKFKDGNWSFPTVVGFVENPKPCDTILSGIIKNGEIVEMVVPLDSPPGTAAVKALRSYKPTQNAWDYPLRKNPEKSPFMFGDEPILAKVDTGAQYAELCPSMFSGRMAKAVQVIMGMGRSVKYDYRWARCHGIVTGADDERWLVEISQEHGVVAVRLPLLSRNKYEGSPQDVLRACGQEFGGVPSGAEFPTGQKLSNAIADGRALQMLMPEEMDQFFSKTPYSSAMGWSFKLDGSEAHNTCYSTPPAATPQNPDPPAPSGYHYKLSLSIGALATDRAPGAPIAACTAELEKVSEGRFLAATITYQHQFGFYDPAEGAFLPPPDAGFFPSGVERAPLVACHINDVLEVLEYVNDRRETYVAGAATPGAWYDTNWTRYNSPFFWDGQTSGASGAAFVSSPRFPSDGIFNSESHTAQFLSSVSGANGGTTISFADIINSTSQASSTGLWGSGGRDSYAVFTGAKRTNVATNHGIGSAPGRDGALDSENWPVPLPLPENTLSVTDTPPALHLVFASGDVAEIPIDDAADPEASLRAWAHPHGSIVFDIRYSVLGESVARAYSRDIAAPSVKPEGPMIDGEPTDPQASYNFIGYI